MASSPPDLDTARRPPRPALVLGFAGLLPPLLAIAGQIIVRRGGGDQPSSFVLAMAGLGYIALILSFLGGMWWGVAAVRLPAERLTGWLVLAVTPTLAAGAAFTFGGAIGHAPWGTAVLLAAALVLALAGDLRLVRAGRVPGWWMRLRVPLSCLLAVEALATAALM